MFQLHEMVVRVAKDAGEWYREGTSRCLFSFKSEGAMNAIVRLQVEDDMHDLWLRDLLPDTYQLIAAQQATPEEAFAFDLCILDEPTLTRNWEVILAWRKRVRPIELPILLLCEEERVRQLSPHLWDVIHDVVSTPFVKPELLGRVRNLLALREASMELQQLRLQLQQAQ